MVLRTWLRKVRDGFIQDDPNPEPSWLDRLDSETALPERPLRAETSGLRCELRGKVAEPR